LEKNMNAIRCIVAADLLRLWRADLVG
jgi:hypothetical protein